MPYQNHKTSDNEKILKDVKRGAETRPKQENVQIKQYRDGEHSSIYNVLAMQAWEPDFYPQDPHKT